jgi:Rad3-related DNA helicase
MDWRTCLTLVQTYGRGMRSADDYCNTYVLDDRFDRFVKVNKGQLPGWFLESIR